MLSERVTCVGKATDSTGTKINVTRSVLGSRRFYCSVIITTLPSTIMAAL
ncbi:hypothetical protein [Sodalis-like endosymbiont of Proechinophthirus fluctus]|nr:hypothetical protein [Sodalis-like endosymbiont of Proechinophthirus fluctus]